MAARSLSQSLKGQILDRLDFENFYRQELGDLEQGQGDDVQAFCPFHEDTNPSLSVNLTSGLFHCFGCEAKGDVFSFHQKRHGCTFKETLEELGRLAGVKKTAYKPPNLTIREFSQAKHLPEDFLQQYGVREFRDAHGHPEVQFDYRGEDGALVAVRRRLTNSGKDKFRWRKGDKVLVYGLWKLAAIRDLGWCLLVEGESDVLTCWRHGIPALGIPGKGTWKPAWAKHFQGLKVFLWKEPDAPELPGKIAKDLPDVQVITAPPGLKDISEAHCQGQDLQALIARLKEEAKPYEPPPRVVDVFSLSDLGNARRLVAQHGQDLRYCHLSKKWFHWTGKFWNRDDSGEVVRRAKETVINIFQEATAAQDRDDRKKIARFALRSENNSRIQAMINLAQSESGIPVSPQEMNTNPWLLNCLNGTIDLRTGELRPHNRADLITRLAPVAYDPEAPCELWEKFLDKIQNGNGKVIEFIQRALGDALTGSCQEQCFFILWGSGANGKSTLLNRITEILGNYALQTPTETLLAKPKGEIPNDVARLEGRRFVTSFEVDRGRRLAESLVKQLTGQDVISARYLYGEYFDFVPQFKLFLSTNNKPIIKDNSNAIWRRIKLIRFTVQLREEEMDQDLPEKLQAESSGILTWVVQGCIDWYNNGGLWTPEEVIEATQEYQAEMDILKDFIGECCIVAGGASATAQELYKAYGDWAENQGEKRPLSQRVFGMNLAERGFEKGKGTGGLRIWKGIGLKA